jgi:hypothetical protein
LQLFFLFTLLPQAPRFFLFAGSSYIRANQTATSFRNRSECDTTKSDKYDRRIAMKIQRLIAICGGVLIITLAIGHIAH